MDRIAEKNSKKWIYKSVDFYGNLHETSIWITEKHPEWDVVVMYPVVHPAGNYTIIVHRIELI